MDTGGGFLFSWLRRSELIADHLYLVTRVKKLRLHWAASKDRHFSIFVALCSNTEAIFVVWMQYHDIQLKWECRSLITRVSVVFQTHRRFCHLLVLFAFIHVGIQGWHFPREVGKWEALGLVLLYFWYATVALRVWRGRKYGLEALHSYKHSMRRHVHWRECNFVCYFVVVSWFQPSLCVSVAHRCFNSDRNIPPSIL
jgi:hypothetical protein